MFLIILIFIFSCKSHAIWNVEFIAYMDEDNSLYKLSGPDLQSTQIGTLQIPDSKWFQKGGKEGIHTEHLGYLLTDLQYMQRTYPNMEW
jgi:hypothetical protein